MTAPLEIVLGRRALRPCLASDHVEHRGIPAPTSSASALSVTPVFWSFFWSVSWSVFALAVSGRLGGSGRASAEVGWSGAGGVGRAMSRRLTLDEPLAGSFGPAEVEPAAREV